MINLIINEVINTKSKNSSLPSSFKSNGIDRIVITDTLQIKNGFCKYFTNIAGLILSKQDCPNVQLCISRFPGTKYK
jgi:hypothetical protein